MCLLVIAKNVHPDYKFILAANRDEFYNRPSEPAHFWEEQPELLAGKDLKAGGTWLGITRQGRIAAITNYRDLKNIKPDAPSRGALVLDYLLGNSSPEEYYNNVKASLGEYNGFNLVFGDILRDNIYYLSNQSNEFKKLGNGIYGLSNCLLDTPWPKVEKIKNSFAAVIEKSVIEPADAFNILHDTTQAADELLPDTGVGLEFERLLSSVFIKSPIYGTRCSTLIKTDVLGKTTFAEKTYIPGTDKSTEVIYEFIIG